MNFKTPSPKMAGFICCVLLALFALSYLAPVLNVAWLRADAKFDAGLQQTLLVLLVGAVAYYLGSTRGSDSKNDTINAQANAAATIAAVAATTVPASTPLTGSVTSASPAGTPADPVSVEVVKPAAPAA